MHYAHTQKGSTPQPLLEHLEQVAKMACGFAAPFAGGALAYRIGLYHDIGKYSQEFQNRLLCDGPKVDHATAGGKEIYPYAGLIGSYCVMGHHAGLPCGGSKYDTAGESSLCGRMEKKVSDYSAFSSAFSSAFPAGISPISSAEFPIKCIGQDGFSLSFLIRMLFSCLVDADFLDTEAYMLSEDSNRRVGQSIPALCAKVEGHIAPYFEQPAASGSLNEKRTAILKSALKKAKEDRGMFSLTVPTGGGKTLASLAFSLEHAKAKGLDRVIYVAPFTTILDQSASVFAQILGEENVIQHHSNVNFDNEDGEDGENESLSKNFRYLATENWDAPVIVTTTVQFFESFFARKNSKCRKLHNVANAVLVFDEIQALPREYIKPCLAVLTELTLNYGCSVVLCTATQPAFQSLLSPIPIREIADDREGLYKQLQRVTMKNLGKQSNEELSAMLEKLPQLLCIVNTRKQAQELYSSLPKKGSYHLSTLLYPKDRLRILEEIRGKLKENKPCRVISTSLVEAGVDLDFPVVYRGQAGLDSLIQAAGRCNREGKRPKEDSFVYYFQEDSTPPKYLRKPLSVVSMILDKFEDPSSLPAIHEYFENLYKIDELDVKEIMKLAEKGSESHLFDFPELERRFRLIDKNSKTVVIPLEQKAQELLSQWKNGLFSKRVLRALMQYSVQVYDDHLQKLLSLCMIEQVDEEIYVLRDSSAYDRFLGLALEPTTGDGIII